jgi:hypothetical protein
MYRQSHRRFFLIVLLISSFMALVTAPALSQNGNGNGQNNGRGRGQGQQEQQEQQSPPGQERERGPQQEPPGQNRNQEREQTQETPPVLRQQNSDLLGCQKNNPDRLDCSSLEVRGYCDGTTAVFIITNTGEQGNGDMVSATSYQLLQGGTVVGSGSVQLGGGQSGLVTYSGGGEVTLVVNQQIGHPGSSRPRVTLNCGSAEATPTEEATPAHTPTPEATPTEEVTPETTPTEEITPEVTPTEEVSPPELYAYGYCNDASAIFYVSNTGPDMSEPVHYVVTDSDGYQIESGSLMLGSGESVLIEVGQFYGPVTLNIDNGLIVESVECYVPVPTEEVEPNDPILEIYPYCEAGGVVIFEIVNTGADMPEPVYFYVSDFDGNIVVDGALQLADGESMMLNIGPQSGRMTLVIGEWLAYSVVECFVATEEPAPTEEATPEPTPTEEVTPEPTPTEEVTPGPTPAPNCQKNNADRLDCSSIEVSGYCEGDVAVFVIRNTGEPGAGDMVQPTEYRLIQNGVVIESGSVQIAGRETQVIYYDGGGRITLEADQQIGHPGKSQPQATLNCGR